VFDKQFRKSNYKMQYFNKTHNTQHTMNQQKINNSFSTYNAEKIGWVLTQRCQKDKGKCNSQSGLLTEILLAEADVKSGNNVHQQSPVHLFNNEIMDLMVGVFGKVDEPIEKIINDRNDFPVFRF
jgi:hypothetical protein